MLASAHSRPHNSSQGGIAPTTTEFTLILRTRTIPVGGPHARADTPRTLHSAESPMPIHRQASIRRMMLPRSLLCARTRQTQASSWTLVEAAPTNFWETTKLHRTVRWSATSELVQYRASTTRCCCSRSRCLLGSEQTLLPHPQFPLRSSMQLPMKPSFAPQNSSNYRLQFSIATFPA